MQYRDLGKSGLSVSEIGYGTWGLGGDSYGDIDDDISKYLLSLAFDNGVNFYDTADLYGNGRSEKLLGDVFKKVRDKVIIASKGGTLPHTGFHMPQDFSADHLTKALENSLERLGTDYIDLYQMHSPKISDLEKHDVIETLERFKKEGKIKSYGVSVRSPDDGKIAIERFNFPVVQVNFNLIDQRAIENGMFTLAGEKKVGIIVRTPLVFGYLTGKLTGNENFHGIDHRKNWPKDQLKKWADASRLFNFLCDKNKMTAAQIAIRFCLDQSQVSTVIPGMMKKSEVEENVMVSSILPFSAEENEKINEIYRAHEFYDKSAKGI
jgi:aryl-alcohol dehydrogenase-like predicted oxidoreductase